MRYFDTHAHLQFPAFDAEREQVVRRILEFEVGVVNVGTQKDTSRKAVEIAKNYENMWAAVGLHPGHTYPNDFEDQNEAYEHFSELEFDESYYLKLAQEDKVVAIGECGLDYYRLPDHLDIVQVKIHQKNVLNQHIEIASKIDKPLIIHCRPSQDSQDAYLDLLEQLNGKGVKFVVHSFTGDAVTASKIIDADGYIGLNGIVTFDKTSRSKEVIDTVPLEKLLVETDCPYLTPVPFRGKKNEPKNVVEIVKFIALNSGIGVEEVRAATVENAKKLFNLS